MPMRALCFEAGQVELQDRDIPEPGPGEALIRVSLAGVCNTDLEIVRGYMGFEGVLGHEFVGVVERCADESWLGQRVCADINFACGECATCRGPRGPHHCPARTVLGIVQQPGAFADYVVAPVANLYRVPEGVADTRAVFAEPLAAAYEILAQVPIEPNTRVMVLGDGKLGLLCAMALATATRDLTVLGRHPRKLSRLGTTGARTLTEAPVVGGGQGERFDVVVEATGSPSGLASALDLVRPRGTIVLKSTFAGTPEVDTNRLVIDEIQLVGSRCGPMDVALAAMERGLDPSWLVDARVPLAEGPDAIRQAAERGTLKVLLEP